MKTVVLLLFLACAAPGMVRAETKEIEAVADPRIYGPYPKDYREIITQWLNATLADASSAYVEWLSPPKAGSRPEKKGGKPFFGYVVEIKVNSRNRFGTYSGMQRHMLFIKDGKVVKATGFVF
jgi:hypothetical protein